MIYGSRAFSLLLSCSSVDFFYYLSTTWTLIGEGHFDRPRFNKLDIYIYIYIYQLKPPYTSKQTNKQPTKYKDKHVPSESSDSVSKAIHTY